MNRGGGGCVGMNISNKETGIANGQEGLNPYGIHLDPTHSLLCSWKQKQQKKFFFLSLFFPSPQTGCQRDRPTDRQSDNEPWRTKGPLSQLTLCTAFIHTHSNVQLSSVQFSPVQFGSVQCFNSIQWAIYIYNG
jgi:hypothetical protein